MLREAGKTSVKEMRLNKTDLKPFVEPLAESLKQLPDILKVIFVIEVKTQTFHSKLTSI